MTTCLYLTLFVYWYTQIPSTIILSDDCHNLLESLLQRNPDKRMSFDEFFEHPFIDLEHTPTSKCLPKAVCIGIIIFVLCITTNMKYSEGTGNESC